MARFFSKTSQCILIHAFSMFGRRLNAYCCLIFGHIFAHISKLFGLRRTSRGGLGSPCNTRHRCVALRATDAGPLINAQVYMQALGSTTDESACSCLNRNIYQVTDVLVDLGTSPTITRIMTLCFSLCYWSVHLAGC